MPPRRRQVTYSQRPTHAARSAHARGDRMFRTYDTTLIRPKKSKAPLIIAIIVLILLVIGGFFLVTNGLKGCSGQELLAEGEEVTLVVAEGSGAAAIGADLEELRLIGKSSDFTRRVADAGKDASLKPGTYVLTGGMTVDEIISVLEAGPGMTGTPVTIPEGYKASDIAARVAEATNGRISAEDFMAAISDASVYAADYSFLAEVGTNSLEGFLFPKTYSIQETDTAATVVRMMLSQFAKETANLNLAAHGLSAYDAVKLASIVEKESSGDEEVRAQVAAVFYNRLADGNSETYGFLQSDATTAYEVGGDPTSEQVHADTPYSTYSNKGLPPTPICSPGLDCLQAVCEPAANFDGYYYFIFWQNDAGEMEYAFSKTYEEHQRAIAENL